MVKKARNTNHNYDFLASNILIWFFVVHQLFQKKVHYAISLTIIFFVAEQKQVRGNCSNITYWSISPSRIGESFAIEEEPYAEDNIGASVNAVGDINGDGIIDILIGSHSIYSNQDRSPCSTYIIFGRRDFNQISTFNPNDLDGRNGFVIQNTMTYAPSGYPVNAAGDVNADGIDDLIVSGEIKNRESAIYVLFGSRTIGSNGIINLNTLNVDSFHGIKMVVTHTQSDKWLTVATVGDVNADGVDDIVVGDPYAEFYGMPEVGVVYIVYGHPTSELNDVLILNNLTTQDGFMIPGLNDNDRFGWSVASAGDINNDGFADILVGAPYANPNQLINAGSTFIIYGGNTTSANNILRLNDLIGNHGFVINGIDAYGLSGWSAASVGDLNGDSIDDLIIGAPFKFNFYGSAYVIFGNQFIGRNGTLSLADLDGFNGFTVHGPTIYASTAGRAVNGIGDINGDGVSDALIGAPGLSSAYIIFGRQAPYYFDKEYRLLSTSTNLGAVINDAYWTYSGAGWSVSTAGDLNGDGVDDFLIGAPGVSKSYVVFCLGWNSFYDNDNDDDYFSGSKFPFIILYTVIPNVCFIGCVVALVCYCRKRRKKRHVATVLPFEGDDRHPVNDLADSDEAIESVDGMSLICFIERNALNIEEAKLGQGAYGSVHKAEWNFQKVAVKKYTGHSLTCGFMQALAREVNIMMQLSHKNLVHLHGFVKEDSFGPAMLVMELCEAGSLYHYLNSQQNITWNLRYRIAYEIVSGLAFLHSNQPPVLHCDLKSFNVVLDQDQHAKLCDFGVARLHMMTDSEVDDSNLDSRVGGTLRWMSPQRLINNESHNINTADDIWSLGMVFFEIGTNKLPFEESMDDSQLADWIREGEGETLPQALEQEHHAFCEIMKSCWSSPNDRISAGELVGNFRSLLSFNQDACSILNRDQDQSDDIQNIPTLSPWSNGY